MTISKKPEWAKKDCKAFTSSVIPGVEAGHDGNLAYNKKTEKSVSSVKKITRIKKLSQDDYIQGILNQNRAILGRAITLVESHSDRHRELARNILDKIAPYTGKSIRLGITGVPGVGKSTFIEALGCSLLDKGLRPAVLAVDPSSSITGGSILGDKTRMEKLSRDNRCFIRPSPSSGTLGGVAQRTRETMMICEAAGFDVILVETVGVGQSEITVRSMVDFFLLLMLANAGDELQGIKKGIMEMADALLINKADGDNKIRAESARSEYERALHYLQPAIDGWKAKAYTCSSLTGEGILEIWSVILSFCEKTKKTGVFYQNRKKQDLNWFHTLIDDQLKSLFFQNPEIKKNMATFEEKICDNSYSPSSAANQLISIFKQQPLISDSI